MLFSVNGQITDGIVAVVDEGQDWHTEMDILDVQGPSVSVCEVARQYVNKRAEHIAAASEHDIADAAYTGHLIRQAAMPKLRKGSLKGPYVPTKHDLR